MTTTRPARPRRLPAAALRGVRVTLLLILAIQISGCAAATTTAADALPSRVEALACQHDRGHRGVCEQASRLLAVNAPTRTTTHDRHLVPCPAVAPPVASIVAITRPMDTEAALPAFAAPGTLLLHLSVARR